MTLHASSPLLLLLPLLANAQTSPPLPRAHLLKVKGLEQKYPYLGVVEECTGSKCPGKVEVTDNALVIEGERKFETKKEEEGYFQTERSYGKFVRSIPLPEGCKPEEIKAELANGVLEVKVPVAETKHTMRRVPIDEKKKG